MLDRELPRFRFNCADCGHRAHVYRRTGNRLSIYFVECAHCKTRSPIQLTPRDAVRSWMRGHAQPITSWSNAPTPEQLTRAHNASSNVRQLFA